MPTIKRVGRQSRASSAAARAVMPRAPPEISTGSPGFRLERASRCARAGSRSSAGGFDAPGRNPLRPSRRGRTLRRPSRSATVSIGSARREVDHASTNRGPFPGQRLDQSGDPSVAGEEIGVLRSRRWRIARPGPSRRSSTLPRRARRFRGPAAMALASRNSPFTSTPTRADQSVSIRSTG